MVTRGGTTASTTDATRGSSTKSSPPRDARGPGGDRRGESARASGRRRAAEDALLDALLNPNAPASESVGTTGQTLLMKALRRLERLEDIQSTVAWAREHEEQPKVIAAYPAEAATRIPPSDDLYRALSRLDRVQRLTDPGLAPALVALGEQGVAAAAPIQGTTSMPAAILLVYAQNPRRPIRPRSIAIVGEVAAKLKNSLSTSMALDRMSRLDDSVRRLDRLATLGGLVSEIVHEIRNPLVSVKTFLQLLPERLDDPDFHQDFRGVVSDEVSRLERMLDDLLRHARPSVTAPVDDEARIEEAIETTLQLLTYRCRERGVVLETEIHPDLPALGLPQDALRQLLLNLLLNATQVTPEEGRIRVTASWSVETANHVELCVEDEGPGLDAGLRQQIFEPFWTSRNEGAGGLGLAICKRIVEEAGGSIGVRDRSRKGACFRIELPISR